MGATDLDLTLELTSLCGAVNVSALERMGPRQAPGAPSWVVRPGAAGEVAEIVRLAARHRVPIVPLGTATRRFARGGPLKASIVVDLRRMTHVLSVDETSLVVHAQAGLTGLRLEELLGHRGLSLGDFPPAALRSSLGGLVAVRTPGKSSPRHGFFEDAVLAISAVLGDGRMVHTRLAPRRATGPNLVRALLGAEGTLGIVTSLHLRVTRRPEARQLASWRVPDVAAGVEGVLALLRADARPAAVRIFDARASMLELNERIAPREAIVTLATAGVAELTRLDRELAGELLEARGGVALGAEPAERWWRARHGHVVPGVTAAPPPQLTLSAPPSALVRTYHAVREAALASGAAGAYAYFSRFDDDGAVIFVGLENPKPETRAEIERAAHDAGASLLGDQDVSMRPYLADLRRSLDPAGVLNPDVLTISAVP